ncbi:MAG: type II toxin-antitoxin system VapB family antitoxin [Myxococcaceae bacterium]
MKTTLEISDALLAEAKKVSAREKTTLRSLVEEGLRRTLADRKRSTRPFRLKLVTLKGKGLQDGLDWDLPRDLAYDFPPEEET